MSISNDNLNYLKLIRHIDRGFAQRFKNSCLYQLYLEHKDELIIAIRNRYINIYHNCDNIAKVRFLRSGEVRCTVNGYYLNGVHSQRDVTLSSEEDIKLHIVDRYEKIIRLSNSKSTDEKKAQQALYLKNNNNPNSNWVCVDVEWMKMFESNTEKQQAQFKGRFDIVAVSKTVPHQIAIIELKYGRDALGGSSGILKHIEDFKKFIVKRYIKDFECEVKEIIKGLKALNCPLTINEDDDFAETPSFFFIVLDNNAPSLGSTTPQQTMGAYLFEEGSENYNKWKTKRPTVHNVQKQLGIDIMNKDSQLPVTCLFSSQRIDNLKINDIIEDNSYTRFNPK